ncbi:WhiB family transcriptional regulator [Streptomyces sp. NPDC006372]|uniref:WhiB family transcriptional regulator n=1 Tax=Streptomyces sp. NPDC006372 TaxID=3155599 RepID=UPI0033B4C61A
MSGGHNLAGARPALALGIPEFVMDAQEPVQCREDPDAWFAEGLRQSDAEALCDGCSFLDVCEAFALERPELFGVWGGTTRRERDRRRRGGLALGAGAVAS